VTRAFIAAVLALAGTAQAGRAQSFSPFSLELRGGLSAPGGALSDAGVGSGPALGVSGRFRFNRILSAYLEFDHLRFSGDTRNDYREQGFGGGVTAGLPTGRVQPFVSAGLVSHQLTLDGLDVPDEQAGYRLGGGVKVPLGRSLFATPALSYAQYRLRTAERTIRHLTADVGLRVDI
jgi:hypothetical protein